MLDPRCNKNAAGEIYSDFWMKAGKAMEKRQHLRWVFEDEQKFGWWIGVWSEGTTIQTEGTAQAKACNFKGMVPWNFVELVVSVVCLKQRMIEIMLLHLLKNHEHSSHSDVEIT